MISMSQTPDQQKKSNKKYSQRFREEWLKDPKYMNWLERVEGNEWSCKCKYCRCVIISKLYDIEKHRNTLKHKKAEESFILHGYCVIPLRKGYKSRKAAEGSQALKLEHSAFGFADHLSEICITNILGEKNYSDDRKVDLGSLSGGMYPPGLSESSTGSGDNQGGCDEVSVPLSPEQFLSEDMEHGGSPHTPSSQRPESYKLRHNNHLTLVLESLAGDESFMDVTLTAQGRAIKAHKSVLSAVSPYFRSVLKENPCQHPIIIMPRDIRFEELNNIISYVYKGEMTVAAEDLSSLLKTAEILQVTGLSPSDSGSGASGIISQMQGQGFTPEVVTNAPVPKRSTRHRNQHHHQQLQTDDCGSYIGPDSQPRIDPLEFLNADMTCVKEEIQSENDETQDSNQYISPVGASGSTQTPSGSSAAVSDSSNIAYSNRRQSTSGGGGKVESPEKPMDEDQLDKPFNPGEPGGMASPCAVSPSPDDCSSSTTTPLLPFMCPHCLETHQPHETLQTHLRLKHPTKPSFLCPCGIVFIRVSLLNEHTKNCKY